MQNIWKNIKSFFEKDCKIIIYVYLTNDILSYDMQNIIIKCVNKYGGNYHIFIGSYIIIIDNILNGLLCSIDIDHEIKEIFFLNQSKYPKINIDIKHSRCKIKKNKIMQIEINKLIIKNTITDFNIFASKHFFLQFIEYINKNKNINYKKNNDEHIVQLNDTKITMLLFTKNIYGIIYNKFNVYFNWEGVPIKHIESINEN